MASDDLYLRGPSLTLRIPRADDSAALYALGRDPEVTRWFSWGPYRDEAQASAWLASLPAQRAALDRLEMVLEHPEAGAIGATGFSEPSARDRRAVIGTWIGKPYWGTGANREGKALMAHLGFEVLGLERIAAYANVDHIRSQRALERLGFLHEGTLRAFHRHDGRPKDVVVMALLRANYESGPLVEYAVEVSGEIPDGWDFSRASPPS